MIITEELRAKILLHLPEDYQKQGAEAISYSRSMIYKVLHEGHDNDIIAEWLINTAKEEKARKERKHKSLIKIAEQL